MDPSHRSTAASPHQHPASVEFGFALGTGQDGARCVFRPALDGHLLLTGSAGTGKTVLLNALVAEAAGDLDVYVADGWQEMGAAGAASTARECTAMLESVLTTVNARVEQCRMEGAGSFAALSGAPRRMLVILDDVRHLLVDDEFSPAGDVAAKARSVECLRGIAESAEMAGVTFVLSSQWPIDAGLVAGHCTRLQLERVPDLPYRSAGRGRSGICTPPGEPPARITVEGR